jgi:hypothetical protein
VDELLDLGGQLLNERHFESIPLQPPFPGTPDDPTLPPPALQVQAALHCAPPDSGAHRRGCRAALGAREEALRGVAAAFPIRLPRGGAKRLFESPGGHDS